MLMTPRYVPEMHFFLSYILLSAMQLLVVPQILEFQMDISLNSSVKSFPILNSLHHQKGRRAILRLIFAPLTQLTKLQTRNKIIHDQVHHLDLTFVVAHWISLEFSLSSMFFYSESGPEHIVHHIEQHWHLRNMWRQLIVKKKYVFSIVMCYFFA